MAKSSRAIVLFLTALFCLQGAGAQEGPSIGLVAAPEIYFPAGARSDSYSTGMGMHLAGLVGIPALPSLSPAIDGSVALIPLNLNESGLIASTNLSLLRGGLGIKAGSVTSDALGYFVRAYAGGYLAALAGEGSGSAGGLAFGGGAGIGLPLSPNVQLTVAAGYDTYLELYDAVAISVGTVLRLAGTGNGVIPRENYPAAGPGIINGYIEFESTTMERLFPVLYKYYDDHPMGEARITNRGRRSIEEVEIRLVLKQLMDAPKVSARIERLKPGESELIDVYALLTEEILSVTEGAKIAAELQASYTVGGRVGSDSEVFTLETYDRNALRWDDDRKIAAFVTAKDDEVLRFARTNATLVDDAGIAALSRELQLAMVFLSAMAEHRCTYAVDPSSSYARLSQNEGAIDSVQFPRQTLEYRAGDCDDLSAAYAALLESVGVATAFITVPGHIYIAFRLELSEKEARSTFARHENLILRQDGSVWVPVETTLLRQGFLAAWAEGAAQWRRFEAAGAAGFWPTAEAWRSYEPVAFGVSDHRIDLPAQDAVEQAFASELNRFVERQLSDREEALLDQLKRQPDDIGSRNRLGILYARYGLYAKAEEQFQLAIGRQDYSPALVNLGNIYLLREEFRQAQASYRRVLERDPAYAPALVGAARAALHLEEFSEAERVYARLQREAPALAERYSYIGSGSPYSVRESVADGLFYRAFWDEE